MAGHERRERSSIVVTAIRAGLLLVALLMLAAPVPYARINQIHIMFTIEESGSYTETYQATFAELWREGKETKQRVAVYWLVVAACLLAWNWFGPRRRRWWLRTLEGVVVVGALGYVEFRHLDIMRFGTYESLIGSSVFDLCVVVFTGVTLFAIGRPNVASQPSCRHEAA